MTGTATRPAGPNFTVGLSGNNVVRRQVSNGAVETLPFGVSRWSPTEGAFSADDNGRYVAFNAANGDLAATRAFVYDMDTAQVLPWSTSGLTVVDNQSSVVRTGADGSYVLTADFSTAGAVASQYTRWAVPSGSTSAVTRPAQHDPSAGGWVVSPNLEWTIFPGSQANIVSGLDSTTRWYRLNNSSGAIDVIPVSIDNLAGLQVVDGGRVVVVLEADNGDQLFTWDGGSAALIEVSVAPDGSPADESIAVDFTRIVANDDGSIITFATFASNLHTGGTAFERDFYQAKLPSLTTGSKLGANEERCLPTQGTEPGDWVTVNITPVEATAGGFGTIHSSDDPAGPTSNVNFAPGTIDPNTAVTKVGTDGNICFTNSEQGPVHLVLDQLTVSPADTFTTPTDRGATRLTDTRPIR